MATAPTVHASAVLVGADAVLIRGASGSGKSRLALDLLETARAGGLRFARLVGDDRVHLEAHHGRLLVRPARQLAGLLEVAGLGIRRLPFEPMAVVALVVDLGGATERLPGETARRTMIAGIDLPRLAVAQADALAAVLAALTTTPCENHR